MVSDLCLFLIHNDHRNHGEKYDILKSSITELMSSYPGQNPILEPDLAFKSARIRLQYLLFKQLLEVF